MRNYITLVLSCATMTAACATGTKVMSAGGEVAPLTPLNRNWLPAGTSMSARLDQSIGTWSSRTGDTFSATVVNPVYAQDGTIAIPSGSVLHGRITGIHNTTVPGENNLIRLAFEDLQMRGRTFPVTASISNVAVERQMTPANIASNARGAVLGGIISGAELSRILTAGLLGAATGTVISMGVGGAEGVMPVASTLTVRTNEDVRIR